MSAVAKSVAFAARHLATGITVEERIQPAGECAQSDWSAVPPNAKSGNAARNFVAKARTSARPRHGLCSEYSKRMSGAASSSITSALKFSPQNSVNHRPTTALFSSIDIECSFPR